MVSVPMTQRSWFRRGAPLALVPKEEALGSKMHGFKKTDLVPKNKGALVLIILPPIGWKHFVSFLLLLQLQKQIGSTRAAFPWLPWLVYPHIGEGREFKQHQSGS